MDIEAIASTFWVAQPRRMTNTPGTKCSFKSRRQKVGSVQIILNSILENERRNIFRRSEFLSKWQIRPNLRLKSFSSSSLSFCSLSTVFQKSSSSNLRQIALPKWILHVALQSNTVISQSFRSFFSAISCMVALRPFTTIKT